LLFTLDSAYHADIRRQHDQLLCYLVKYHYHLKVVVPPYLHDFINNLAVVQCTANHADAALFVLVATPTV